MAADILHVYRVPFLRLTNSHTNLNFSQPLAFSLCSLPPVLPQTRRNQKGNQTSSRRQFHLQRQERGNTRHSAHLKTQAQQVKDKTALEIAANEALFGQTGGGADEPWVLGLSSTNNSSATWGASDANWLGNNSTQLTTAAATTTTGDFFTRNDNHNLRIGNSGGNSVRKAKGSDSLLLADAPSMGNYDRDAHLRLHLPHRITGQQVAATSTGTAATLPYRMKGSNTSGNYSNTGPYFHHLLDRNSSNSSTNSLLFNPNSNFADSVPVSTNSSSKRPRSSNSSNFTAPFGFPSPFEAEHPLPDFNTNWGFNGRNVPRSGSSIVSAPISTSNNMTISSHSTSNVTTTSSLSGIGSGLSSPNGMFTSVDSFLPDYDSTLYALWNAPSGVGYETENDASQSQNQQVPPPPLYITSDDELKMDYPQLPEFNQDLDSYLNDTMESGGPSPTTPLGTSAAHSMMKMEHLVTMDRRSNAGVASGTNLTSGNREPQLERLLAPASATATAEYLVKRGRDMVGLDTTGHATKRSRGAYDGAYSAETTSSSTMTGSTPSASSSYRSVSKNPTIEPKRAVMPSLGSYQCGQSLLKVAHTATSQVVSTGTTTVTSTSIVSDAGSTKAAKRPRSRQCEFPGCQNRARSHQKCKKHGGAHQCVFEGCTKNSQSRGLCIAHGGGSRCKREGCVRAAQSKGLCKSHGGGEFCAVVGCNKKAHLKHLCRTHGGGVRCKFEKCSKWAQRKGWCMAHAKEFAAT